MHQVSKVLLKSALFHGNPWTKLQNGAERIIVLLVQPFQPKYQDLK